MEDVAAAKWEATRTVITSKGDIDAAGLLDVNKQA